MAFEFERCTMTPWPSGRGGTLHYRTHADGLSQVKTNGYFGKQDLATGVVTTAHIAYTGGVGPPDPFNAGALTEEEARKEHVGAIINFVEACSADGNVCRAEICTDDDQEVIGLRVVDGEVRTTAVPGLIIT